MRVVPVVALISGFASADPAKVTTPTGPSKVVEVQPWEPPARATTKVPGVNGIPSAGIVIPTDPGGDARPYPYGAWIRTPDIGDRNVLELGTDSLPGSLRSEGLAARLSRGFDASVGKVLELVMPPAKLVK